LILLLTSGLSSLQGDGTSDPANIASDTQSTAPAGTPDSEVIALVQAERARFDALYAEFASSDMARNQAGLGVAFERRLARAPTGEWERLHYFTQVYTVCRVLAERGDPGRATALGERLARRLAQERQSGKASDEVAEYWTALEADVWMEVLNDVDAAAAVLEAPGAAWSDRHGMIAQRRERVADHDRAQIAQTLAGELMRERIAAEQRVARKESE